MKLGADMIIVCATDLSEPSRRALDSALTIARGLGATGLRLLYVDETLAYIAASSSARYAQELERIQSDAKAEVERLAERASAQSGLVVVPIFRAGSAWPEVVDYAKEESADLVVVGSHGRTGLRRVFLGSVAENVVRHAPCSVITVKVDASTPTG